MKLVPLLSAALLAASRAAAQNASAQIPPAPAPTQAPAPAPNPTPAQTPAPASTSGSTPTSSPTQATGAPAQTNVAAPVNPPAAPPSTAPAPAAARAADGCAIRDITKLGRNPTPAELRCRYGAKGPGRFGLLSYLDVPVYQPRTPQPGTHVVGVPGMPHPQPGETYEEWEWRVLRTSYGPETRGTRRDLQSADPVFAAKLMRLEREAARRGIRASRRETWRAPERQAAVFQQGRSRPGPIATTTLTSWHTRVDRLGRPAARAADYDVAPGQMARFHALADSLGLMTYGADSNDPGHVYLPDTDAATGMEIAVLRLVPRVPHVTLETGRPVDDRAIPGMPNYWRDLTSEFIARPRPFPALDPAPAAAPPLRMVSSVPPRPVAPPPPAETRRGRRRR